MEQPSSVQALLSSREFYVAHRGSGDNWPEHTLEAYQSSLKAGAHAVEISVRRTKDGVLVCHHDADLKRTSGISLAIADIDWKQAAQVKVDARSWLGPNSTPRPIPKLQDVLKQLPADCLVFIEDKDGTSTKELLDLIDAQQDATRRFVWKQWGKASQFRAAKERGYATWGYFGVKELADLRKAGAEFDAIGVEVASDDDFVREAVGLGRPVIAWEVHRRSDRDRLRALGVTGMMCSNIPYVMKPGPLAATDAFGTGIRAAGDLPFVADRSWRQQPLISPDTATLLIDQRTEQMSYLLGSLGPIVKDSYRLRAEIAFGQLDPTVVGGLAICAKSDAAYSPATANPEGTYQIATRLDGTILLAEHAAGSSAARSVGSLKTTAVRPGVSIGLEVDIDPQRIVVKRAGQQESFTFRSLNYRGGYMHLWAMRGPVTFSHVSVD